MITKTNKLKYLISEEIKKEIKRQQYLSEGTLMTEDGIIVEGFFSWIFQKIQKLGEKIDKFYQDTAAAGRTAVEFQKISDKATYDAKITIKNSKEIYDNAIKEGKKQALNQIQDYVKKPVNNFFTKFGKESLKLSADNNIPINILGAIFENVIYTLLYKYMNDFLKSMGIQNQSNAMKNELESINNRTKSKEYANIINTALTQSKDSKTKQNISKIKTELNTKIEKLLFYTVIKTYKTYVEKLKLDGESAAIAFISQVRTSLAAFIKDLNTTVKQQDEKNKSAEEETKSEVPEKSKENGTETKSQPDSTTPPKAAGPTRGFEQPPRGTEKQIREEKLRKLIRKEILKNIK